MNLVDLCERGWIPDSLTRIGIRRLNAQRIRRLRTGDAAARAARQAVFLEALARGPVAPHGESARAQHYEVPAAFFEAVLGPRLKYSCCEFPDRSTTLAEAEARMLTTTVERAGVEDGMRILELGCGWGSLSLWLAERFPDARITAVSNSGSQKAFIDARSAAAGLGNLEVVTDDMDRFDTGLRFDRIVSVEMFEHMRNYHELLTRCRSWLAPGGELFVHIFCHHAEGYFYEDADGRNDDWMARHFFENGVMPSFDVFDRFTTDFTVRERWWMPGTHYRLTSEAWLRQLDHQRETLLPLFETHPDGAAIMLQRWRMFFLAVSEMFATRNGEEWGVGHYRLAPVAAPAR